MQFGLSHSSRAGTMHLVMGQAASCQCCFCAGMHGWQSCCQSPAGKNPIGVIWFGGQQQTSHHAFSHGSSCIRPVLLMCRDVWLTHLLSVTSWKQSHRCNLLWVTAAEQAPCIFTWGKLHHASVGPVQECMADTFAVSHRLENNP